MVRKYTVSKNTKKEIKKEVKQQLKKEVELKQTLFSNSGTVDYSGTLHPISVPTQGDDRSQRIGDSILCKHINIRGVIRMGSGETHNLVRVIAFHWLVDDALQVPTASMVLNGDYYVNTSFAPLSPLVFGVDRKQISIISDNTYLTSDTSQTTVKFHINKKLRRRIYFNAGLTTGINKVYVLVISDDAAAFYPSVEFVSEITYTDS